MSRPARAPLPLGRCATLAAGAALHEPLTLLPFLLAAGVGCLLAIPLGAAGGLPSALLGTILTAWLATPWSVHAVASWAWRRSGGAPVALEVQLRSGLQALRPTLLATLVVLLLAPCGMLLAGLGTPLILGLGLWLLGVVCLEGAYGRAAAARAWRLAGAGGLLWSTLALALGLVAGLYLQAGVGALLGPAAVLLVAPATMAVAVPLTAAALLDRRAR